MQNHYHYIIAGAGCAGLSLLKRMLLHPFFNNKKILLIDKSEKSRNDKTWCFWEKQPGLFENIVFHKWQQIDFYSNDFSARFDLMPYQYKMIRSIDFYQSVLDEIKNNSCIDRVSDDIVSIETNAHIAFVKTGSDIFTADFVFNSILFENSIKQGDQKNNYYLLQHFHGWMIETNNAIFNEQCATFMDFRVNQNNGTCFAYMLPVAKNKALVEITFITKNIFRQQVYEDALKNYIHSFLNAGNYTVIHSEYGTIPMTNYKFPKGENRIINMGTAGGATKGSSGFTFQFIQKHSDKIIDALTNNKPLLNIKLYPGRFNLYDRIFLNVICHNKLEGGKLFEQLFSNNPVKTILKFLDNETGFNEELKIMKSVSARAFLPSAIQEATAYLFS